MCLNCQTCFEDLSGLVLCPCSRLLIQSGKSADEAGRAFAKKRVLLLSARVRLAPEAIEGIDQFLDRTDLKSVLL